MFNIGIIGARGSTSLLKLTSRLLTTRQADFQADGRLYLTSIGTVSGEWYVTGPVLGIGSSYEARYTLQAGSAPVGGAGAMTTSWQTISSTLVLFWDSGVNGRVLVEIRDKATLTIQASAQFWSSAAFAP